MQVFIVGTPLETAKALDGRRLQKQIVECEQILDAMRGKKAWSNHPCVLQYSYKEGYDWLVEYLYCLKSYKDGNYDVAQLYSDQALWYKPNFHTQEYFDQMKRRLYTKNKEHYNQWSYLGESEENWYFVDGEWRKYINGKRME